MKEKQEQNKSPYKVLLQIQLRQNQIQSSMSCFL